MGSMKLTYAYLRRFPKVFRSLTGLKVSEFEQVLTDLLPRYEAAEFKRLDRPNRKRAIGGGDNFDVAVTEQLVLSVMWLRVYPVHEVLGFLFGVSGVTAGRVLARWVPVLERAGRDTMRMPDPGKKHRRRLQQCVQATPELAVMVDSFEQRVQRAPTRTEADRYYSGKKKQHTLKSQIAVDETTGWIVDVAESVPGPTADKTLLEQSGLAARLPTGVGLLGDLAYVGLAQVHPLGLGATPRRKPRNQPRPTEDIAYNTAFAKRRVVVEHTIGRLRRYQALTQTDRHHRQRHTARVVAVAGLVNRQMKSRLPN